MATLNCSLRTARSLRIAKKCTFLFLLLTRGPLFGGLVLLAHLCHKLLGRVSAGAQIISASTLKKRKPRLLCKLKVGTPTNLGAHLHLGASAFGHAQWPHPPPPPPGFPPGRIVPRLRRGPSDDPGCAGTHRPLCEENSLHEIKHPGCDDEARYGCRPGGGFNRY